MHIVICLDYSSYTKTYLEAIKGLLPGFKDCEVSVVHVVDETLFASGSGYEIQLGEELKNDNEQLKELAMEYLGPNLDYISDYGFPSQKIAEILNELNYDVLIIGRHSRSILGLKLLGDVAAKLLHNSKKPVLVIP